MVDKWRRCAYLRTYCRKETQIYSMYCVLLYTPMSTKSGYEREREREDANPSPQSCLSLSGVKALLSLWCLRGLPARQQGGLAVVVVAVDHIATRGSDMDGVQDGPQHLAKRPARARRTTEGERERWGRRNERKEREAQRLVKTRSSCSHMCCLVSFLCICLVVCQNKFKIHSIRSNEH